MRSVVVVLPASMCAMMPILRTFVRSVSTSCATAVFSFVRVVAVVVTLGGRVTRRRDYSPAVVCEGSVRLGHLVRVLTPLDGRPKAIAGIQDFVCQPLGHRLLPALPREADQPPQSQSGRPFGPNLDGHLIGGTADAAATHLQRRLDVVQGPLERNHRIGAGLIASLFERCIYNALGEGFLPLHQTFVDQLGDQLRAVYRVVNQRTLGRWAFARHQLFSFLAP